MNEILGCRQCPLHRNQRPLLQDFSGSASVMFVGLSAVAVDDVDASEPLCGSTRSGALVREIAAVLPAGEVYFTNLVKCLPLSGEKIRYPSSEEMVACSSNLSAEIERVAPKRIVCLGRQVSDFASRSLGVTFKPAEAGQFKVGEHGEASVLAAHHPSFVLIYRRRQLPEYVAEIRAFLRGGDADVAR